MMPMSSHSPSSIQPRQDLEAIFNPRSIAVVGASTNPGKQGYVFVQALKKLGFGGPVYPVNPRVEKVAGLRCYPSINEVPDPLDYVISAVPAALVPQLVKDAIRKGVKALHLFTGRMADTGTEEGASQQRGLAEEARAGGLRIIGPNCMGVYVPGQGVTFRLNFPREQGPVAFVTQSGANAVELVYRASLRGIFFSKVISYGNAADLDESDFLEYLTHDPETSVIACYIEGVKDGKRFFKALREAAEAKPVLVLKGGSTRAGTRAVASHTASLAGTNQVWDTAIHQTNAIRVDNLDDMADMMVAFRYMSAPEGRRAAVVCGGGGNSVHSADACEANGLEVPPLPRDIREEIHRLLPDTGFMASNPIDGSALAGVTVLADAAGLMSRHKAFDVVMLDPDFEFIFEQEANVNQVYKTIEGMIAIRDSSLKPLTMVIRSGDSPEDWRWKTTMEVRQKAWRAGLPVFPTMERAARAVVRVIEHNARRNSL